MLNFSQSGLFPYIRKKAQAGIILLCAVGLFHFVAHGQDDYPSWFKKDGRGRTFQIINTGPISWEAANDLATSSTHEGRRGHLATLNNYTQQQFVETFIGEVFDNVLWLGGFQSAAGNEPEGGWTWVNEEGAIPMKSSAEAFSNWASFEPDDFAGKEDHLAINLNYDGKWSDEGIFPVNGLVIEYEEDDSTGGGNGGGGLITGGGDSGGGNTGGGNVDIAKSFGIQDRKTGGNIWLSDFEGQVLVLDFFAYWCGPCRNSSPDLEINVNQYFQARGGNQHGVPVKVLAVNIEPGSPASTDAFISGFNLDWVADDFSGSAYNQFATGGIPLFVIINGVEDSPTHQQWEIVYRQAGYAGAEKIRSMVNQIRPAAVASLPVLIQGPESLLLNEGQTGSLEVSASGSSLTYTWYKDGMPVSGSNGDRLTIGNASASDAGFYHVRIENAAGSIATEPVYVAVEQEQKPDDSDGPVVYATVPELKPYQFDPLDTEDLYSVYHFYQTVYKYSDGIDPEWNGNISGGKAGDTSLEFKKAVIRRVNFFRAMAGVPAKVEVDLNYSSKAQKAALIMSANNDLSHYPDESWTHYSTDGAEAARSSNLYLGESGPNSVTGYIDDGGSNNFTVGHRRWILYPNAQSMGTGDVFPVSGRRANALWVFDDNMWGPRPATRNAFVAWPNDGFVPYQLIPSSGRWSFSLPRSLNPEFSSAQITMKRNGARLSVTKELLGQGAGDDTLVWRPTVLSGYAPEGIDVYDIEINNVIINGQARSYYYQVKVFDPESPDIVAYFQGPSIDKHPSIPRRVVAASLPDLPVSGVVWEMAAYGPVSSILHMESGVSAEFSVSNNYTLFDFINGRETLHLAHVDDVQDQVMGLSDDYLLDENSRLSFEYFVGLASPGQVLRVYALVDSTESLLWETAGKFSGNVSWSDRPQFLMNKIELSLSKLAGKQASFKVAWEYDFGKSYYSGASLSPWYHGCFIRNMKAEGVRVLKKVERAVTKGNFLDLDEFNSNVHVRAAPILFGGFESQFTPSFNFGGPIENAHGSLRVSLVGSEGSRMLLLQWDPSELDGNPSLQVSKVLGSGARWQPATDHPVVTQADGMKAQLRPLDQQQRFFRLHP